MNTNDSTFVKELYEKGVQEIRSELRSYWLNHSFLLGYHWVNWDWDHKRINEVSEEGDRIQATMNRTRANMRTIMANLTQRELTFENPPTAYDDQTIRAARIGEAAIEDVRHAHHWEVLREKWLTALVKGGTAAISVDWDAANNETVETVLSIGEFVVEPGVLEARKARYWIRRQALPQNEVWSMFKDHFPEDPPAADTVSSLDPYMHRIVNDDLGFGDQIIPRTHVYTYYERPNPLCPDGKILVEVGGKIVQHIEKWPFPFKDRLNLVPGVETVVEGRWYGATFMDDVRPVQVALNAAWSNILEHLADAGAAKLAVEQSNVDLINALSDVPGEIIEYLDGTQRPGYISPAQLTGWIRELPDMLAATIDDIMGVHDVSRGMAPANIESGLGLSILAENDSSPVGRLIKETARVFTEVSQMVLMLLEDNVKEETEMVIMDGLVPVKYPWKGEDIQGQHAIHIPLDAIIPRSRAAMQAFADKAMEMGLIQDVVQYARVADLPGQEDLIAAADPDVAKARRENGAFVMEQVPLPATFDDHEKHILTHNDFRKTKRYELLNDEEREIVDLHIQAHETFLAEAIGEAEQDAMLSQALAAAPTADGPVPVDPALLGQQAAPFESEDLTEAPPQIDNAAVDPQSTVADIIQNLPQ